jgi:hypothetical protein
MINSPTVYIETLISISLATPWGGECMYVSEGDPRIATYEADPDSFAAKHFGLSKNDYVEWIKFGGMPRCGARTRKGTLCENSVGRSQMEPAEFFKLHRSDCCACHGGGVALRSHAE